jgi:hypothetical protein
VEVIIRPVNDEFLHEVVFPAFELGVIEAEPALERLATQLNDEESRVNLDLLLDKGVRGGFWGLEDPRWFEICYRLLFWDWYRDGDGWTITEAFQGFAGKWEDTLHLSLMLEDPRYPYEHGNDAREERKAFFTRPDSRRGLSSMICGAWDPVPSFPPDQVMLQVGEGLFRPDENVARADWSWRPMKIVNQWAAQLPNALSRLLTRESQRLKPVEAPEKHEILEYWLGRTEEPPVLAVSFSGLGPETSLWIREIGQIARVVRNAAAQQQGLTSVVSHHGTGHVLFAD